MYIYLYVIGMIVIGYYFVSTIRIWTLNTWLRVNTLFFIFLPPSDSFCRSKSIFKFALPSQIEFIPLRATTPPPQLVYNIHFIVIPCINSEIAQHSFSIIGFLRDILSVNQDCLTTFSRRSVKKCLQALLEI